VIINPGGTVIDPAPEPPSAVVLDVGSGETARHELG